jgi:hypothetical protein
MQLQNNFPQSKQCQECLEFLSKKKSNNNKRRILRLKRFCLKKVQQSMCVCYYNNNIFPWQKLKNTPQCTMFMMLMMQMHKYTLQLLFFLHSTPLLYYTLLYYYCFFSQYIGMALLLAIKNSTTIYMNNFLWMKLRLHYENATNKQAAR